MGQRWQRLPSKAANFADAKPLHYDMLAYKGNDQAIAATHLRGLLYCFSCLSLGQHQGITGNDQLFVSWDHPQ